MVNFTPWFRSTAFMLLLLSLLPSGRLAFGQDTGTSRKSEKWVVLIGVDQYANAKPLQYAVADQQALRDEFVGSGLDERQVTLVRDKAEDTKYLPFKSNIEQQIKAACKLAERGDLVLIVFSGHGRHVGKKSYICPTDGRLDNPETMVALEWIYDQLKTSKADLKMLIVDACRDVDPFLAGRRSGSEPDRKEEMRAFVSSDERLPDGLIQLHSCSEGEKANEDSALGHGVFTYYLLEGLRGKADVDKNGQVTLGELMSFSNRETKLYVRDKFGEIQRPKVSGNYTLDAQDFEMVSISRPKITTPSRRMRAADAPKPPLPTGEESDEITNSIGMKLKLIPAGEFLMGSNETRGDLESAGFVLPEDFDNSDEHPQHKVQISKSFYLGIHEVTKGQFAAFVKDAGYQTEAEKDGKGGWGIDSAGGGGQKPEYNWQTNGMSQADSHPVVNVTWSDSVAFCRWLSEQEGKEYRLPTEAEWEYSCRCGSRSHFSSGDGLSSLKSYANVLDSSYKAKYVTNDDKKYQPFPFDDGWIYTSPVGRFKENGFGLYDMHGNVWEWCSDWYDKDYYSSSAESDPSGVSSGSYRVIRGGGWGNTAGHCRSAYRYRDDPSVRDSDLGFRLALSPSGQ